MFRVKILFQLLVNIPYQTKKCSVQSVQQLKKIQHLDVKTLSIQLETKRHQMSEDKFLIEEGRMLIPIHSSTKQIPMLKIKVHTNHYSVITIVSSLMCCRMMRLWEQ